MVRELASLWTDMTPYSSSLVLRATKATELEL